MLTRCILGGRWSRRKVSPLVNQRGEEMVHWGWLGRVEQGENAFIDRSVQLIEGSTDLLPETNRVMIANLDVATGQVVTPSLGPSRTRSRLRRSYRPDHPD